MTFVKGYFDCLQKKSSVYTNESSSLCFWFEAVGQLQPSTPGTHGPSPWGPLELTCGLEVGWMRSHLKSLSLYTTRQLPQIQESKEWVTCTLIFHFWSLLLLLLTKCHKTQLTCLYSTIISEDPSQTHYFIGYCKNLQNLLVLWVPDDKFQLLP